LSLSKVLKRLLSNAILLHEILRLSDMFSNNSEKQAQENIEAIPGVGSGKRSNPQ